MGGWGWDGGGDAGGGGGWRMDRRVEGRWKDGRMGWDKEGGRMCGIEWA